MLTALLLLLWTGPAGANRHRDASTFGREVARVAERYRETQPKLRINACNGLVEDILRDAGLPIRGAVRTLHATMKERGWVHRRQRPFPGDVVFFDRTYDSNGNGRQDDKLSHIAVVISVDDDGTVHMVHRGSKGIRPLTMNLEFPSARTDPAGKRINSWLGKPGYAKEGARLAGELWASFATPAHSGQTRLAAVGGAAEPRSSSPAVAAVASSPQTAERSDARPVSRPRPPLTGPPLAADHPSFVRAFKGRRLRARHLDGSSCLELWYLRNALFARHGYTFRTPDARRAFAQVPGYKPKSKVTRNTVDRRLSERDRANLDAILSRERLCRR